MHWEPLYWNFHGSSTKNRIKSSISSRRSLTFVYALFPVPCAFCYIKANGTDLRTFLTHQWTLVQGVWGRHSVPQRGVWGVSPQSGFFSKNDYFLLKSIPFILRPTYLENRGWNDANSLLMRTIFILFLWGITHGVWLENRHGDAATRRRGEINFHSFWCTPFMRATYQGLPIMVKALQ